MKLDRRGFFKTTGALAAAPVLASFPTSKLKHLGEMVDVGGAWYRLVEVLGGEGQFAEWVGPDQVVAREDIPKDISRFAGDLGMWPPAGCYKGDTSVKGKAWVMVVGVVK